MAENTPTPADLAAKALSALDAAPEDDYPALGPAWLLKDALEAVAAERDALAAVIEQAPHGDGCGAGCQLTMCTLEHACVCWKSTAPATVLAQAKADAWDEGWESAEGATQCGLAHGPENPYLLEREAH